MSLCEMGFFFFFFFFLEFYRVWLVENASGSCGFERFGGNNVRFVYACLVFDEIPQWGFNCLS